MKVLQALDSVSSYKELAALCAALSAELQAAAEDHPIPDVHLLLSATSNALRVINRPMAQAAKSSAGALRATIAGGTFTQALRCAGFLLQLAADNIKSVMPKLSMLPQVATVFTGMWLHTFLAIPTQSSLCSG